jgi:surface antigen
MRIRHILLVAMTALALGAVAQPSAAHDRKSHGRNPEVKVEAKKNKYKYEYKDGRCEFKYEYKYKQNEEKHKEKGDCRHVARYPNFHPPGVYRHRDHSHASTRPAPPPPPRRERAFCNSDVLGTVVGGAAGAVLGSQVGKGDARIVAIFAGAVVGAVIGNEIGRRIDEADRRCIGHALEFGEVGQAINMSNPDTGLDYVVRPQRSYEDGGRRCRQFDARFGDDLWRNGRACRADDGVWQIVELH